nr:hypothetical protein [Tanacetum cinerariifolium]
MPSFQALYGRPPPTVPSYLVGSSLVASIDETLVVHRQLLDQLKETLDHTCEHMLSLANHHRMEKTFTVARIGKVAYRLELPPESRIHPVFHVALLRQCFGDAQAQRNPLPHLTHEDIPILQPSAIIGSLTSYGIQQVLVSWKGCDPSEASWEDAADFQKSFLDLEDKAVVSPVGIDSNSELNEQLNNENNAQVDE